MRDARRCTRKTTEASSATHIAPHVPAGLHSGHIEAPDIGITRGMPSSRTSTTSKTMTATFSTSMTVPPARSERPLSGDHAADGAHQLLALLVWLARTSLAADDAVSEVPVEQSEADLVETAYPCLVASGLMAALTAREVFLGGRAPARRLVSSRHLFLFLAQSLAGPRRPGEEVIAVVQLDRVVVADRLVPAARAAVQSEACRGIGLLL